MFMPNPPEPPSPPSPDRAGIAAGPAGTAFAAPPTTGTARTGERAAATPVGGKRAPRSPPTLRLLRASIPVVRAPGGVGLLNVRNEYGQIQLRCREHVGQRNKKDILMFLDWPPED